MNRDLPAGALQKPARGSALLERAFRRTRDQAEERAAIAEAKRLDSYRCQWPEPHVCRGGLEGVHVVDKSLGGANVPENIVTVCRWLHRAGPESIHGKQLKVEREGLGRYFSFWKQTDTFDALGQPEYRQIARQTPRGIERD